jgi:spore coat polysaccharide biosynthesis protein SpsF
MSMNIGALIPVRLASERLPGKALLPIAGRPVIAHLLDRLFASRYLTPDRVVVCTTEEDSDDPLVPVVEAMGAKVFRGSRDDIIDRFYQAVQVFGFDAVIQADGDDPCTDTLYMDLCMDRLVIDESLDIVVTEGLPLGLGSKAIRTSAIQTVWEHYLTERNDTGFILYFTRTGLCKKDTVYPISPDHQHETARLTLDYPEDLAFLRALFQELYTEGEVFGVEQIMSLLRRRPDLLAINSGLDEHYWQRTRERAKLEYQIAGRTYRVEV